MCTYLTYDCKGFSVDQDLNQMRQKMVQQANVVEFNKLNLDITDSLMFDKEESSYEELKELERESRERKQGRRVYKRMKLWGTSQAKGCPKHCKSLTKL